MFERVAGLIARMHFDPSPASHEESQCASAYDCEGCVLQLKDDQCMRQNATDTAGSL